MAYVRLEDSALNHPKIARLRDSAFRLWVWGLCYSQMHLTDGFIDADLMPARSTAAAAELVTRKLWEPAEGGYQIHDYLQYNDSKETVEARKQQARDRMRDRRSHEERRAPDVPRSSSDVHANTTRSPREAPFTSIVLTSEKEKTSGELGERARRLLEDLYPRWYSQERHGAKLRVINNTLAFGDAMTVVGLWDDARIEKLARVFLTTNEDWISGTDRNFRLFASKATWCDDRLTQAEKAKGAA